MTKTFKNILNNGMNNVTTSPQDLRAALTNLKANSVQDTVTPTNPIANNNMIVTPTVQQPEVLSNNAGVQKLQQLSAQNNVNQQAFQNQSRFIGFQTPQTTQTSPATDLVATQGEKETRGKTFNKLVNGGYTVITPLASNVKNENRMEEERYRQAEDVIKDFSWDVRNSNGTLTSDDIKRLYKEFDGNEEAALQLQADILPLVQQGEFPDMKWVSQTYPELLKAKEIKDEKQIKQDSENLNKKYQVFNKRINTALKSNVETLSYDGLTFARDADILNDAVKIVKDRGVVGGANDYEILTYLIDNNETAKGIWDEMKSLNLTDKDKAVFGMKDAGLMNIFTNEVLTSIKDLAGMSSEFQANDEEIERALRAKAPMEEESGYLTKQKMKTEFSKSLDTYKKFAKKFTEDTDILSAKTDNVWQDIMPKSVVEMIQGRKLTDEEYKQIVESNMLRNQQQIAQDQESVLEYNKKINEAFAKLQDQNLNPNVESYYNDKGLTNLLLSQDWKGFKYKTWGEAAGNWEMIPNTIVSAINPPAGMALMSADTYARESQEAFETMIDHGASYDEATELAIGVGVINAAVEVGLDRLLGGVETTASGAIRETFMKNIQEEAIKKGLGKIMLDAAGGQIKSNFEEGLEEVVQQIVQNAAIRTVDENHDLFEGLPEAFEGGFYNPMNFISGGWDLTANIYSNRQGISNNISEAVSKTKQKVSDISGTPPSGPNGPTNIQNVIQTLKNKVTTNNQANTENNQANVEENQTNMSITPVNNNIQNNEVIELQDDDTATENNTAIKEGGLTNKVLEHLNGLDENTRERIKKNPYSVEESKNLIEEMDNNPGIDFGEYQNSRYEDVLNEILEKLEQKENKRKNDIGGLYDKLEEANVNVDVTGLKNRIAEFEAQADALGDIITPAEQAQIKTILKNINEIGDGTMDVWKARRIADKWTKGSANSTYDGIGLIRDIRDSIDEVIREQNPDMKEVDKSYHDILKEIGEIKGNLVYKKGGQVKNNAVSTVKNLLNASNRLYLNNLEKYLPGITDKLQAIRDSKFVYNAYTTGKGSRFISGIARGVFGNLGKALGFVGFGWAGLIGGAVLDSVVDKALINLTRTALKDTITKETEKSKAELERINKKIEEGKKLDAEDKARLKALGEKIMANAEKLSEENGKKAEWNRFIQSLEENVTPQTTAEEQEKNKVTKKKATKKNKVTEKKAETKKVEPKKEENQTKKAEPKSTPITKDSEGNTLSAEDQERFKNSKVVNDKGEIKVVMHGTPIQEAFNEYNESKAGSNVQADFKGIYFTDNLELADQFSHEQLPGSSAFRVKLGEKGHIYKSYLNMENPLDLNTATPEQLLPFFKEDALTKTWDEAKRLNNLEGHPQFVKFHVDMNKVENAGYDGIIAAIGKEGEGNEYIVFKGNQAKNIGEVEAPATEEKKSEVKKEQPKNKVTEKKTKVTAPKQETKAERITAPKKERTIIKDSDGNNVLVYHGTDAKYDKFDRNFIKKGNGFWFTTSKQDAESYGKNTKEYNLTASNILDTDAEEWSDLADKLIKQYTNEKFNREFYISPEAFIQDEGLSNYVQELGYDALKFTKGDVTRYIVYNEDQILPLQKQTQKEKPKNNVTAKKTEATNPSKAKETGLFNENEVDRGKESEGLNPDAMPLSDYREMQRLNNGTYYSLADALRHESFGEYMATKIATDLVGDYNEIISEEFDPENLEDKWVSVHTAVEEMYDFYEDYLKTKEKISLESADDEANRLIKGKTAKELVDQYAPEYKSDLKIYDRLSKAYPKDTKGNINLNELGEQGKSLRKLANQDNETAQDIDYQELAELENETPQNANEEIEGENPKTYEEIGKGFESYDKFDGVNGYYGKIGDYYIRFNNISPSTYQLVVNPKAYEIFEGVPLWTVQDEESGQTFKFNNEQDLGVFIDNAKENGVDTAIEEYNKSKPKNLITKKESKPKNLVTAKAVENNNTEQSEFEVLPDDVSIEKEAKEAGPKRIAPDRIPRQQLTYDEGVKKLQEQVKTVAEYIKASDDLRAAMYGEYKGEKSHNELTENYKELGRKAAQILWKDWQFKSDKSKEFKDLWKNIRDNLNNEKGLDEIGKTFYISKVKKDISRGYMFPQEVLKDIPGAKKAIDSRERYQKGLDTSFSSKDNRIDYSEKDKIGAGIKSQDGKQVTKEQKENIVKGVMDFQKVFSIDMKRIAEELGFVYVDLHGGNVFLSEAAGVYRREYNKDGTVKNSSVSVGGSETVRFKDKKTGEWKSEKVNTTMSHELGHVVDRLVEGNLIRGYTLSDLRRTFQHRSSPNSIFQYGPNSSFVRNYLSKDTEIVARAFEQYMDMAKGGNNYIRSDGEGKLGYWSKSDFETIVKPTLEKAIKEKLGDWYINPDSIKYQKNVVSNGKNKITAKAQQVVQQANKVTEKEISDLSNQLKKTGLAKDVVVIDSEKDLFNIINGTKDQARLQSVWHGSKANFNRFDSNHMGEGEGVQSHGWGHYVGVDKGLIKKYYTDVLGSDYNYNGLDYRAEGERGKLGVRDRDMMIDRFIREMNNGEKFNDIKKYYIKENEFKIKDAEWGLKEMEKKGLNELEGYSKDELKTVIKLAKDEIELVNSLKKEDFAKGHLYEVEIPDTINKDTPTGTNYWDENDVITDKQFGKIADVLKEKYPSQFNNPNGWYDDYLFAQFLNFRQGGFSEEMNGRQIYNMLSEILGGDKEASKFLESLGYDGIHYDGQRDGEAYVIFNDNNLEITDHIRYLKDAKGDIAGAVTPDGTVYLIKNNLRGDTLTHEFSHLLRSYAKQNNSDLFNAINKIAEEAPQELKDYVKATYGDLSADAFLDEVFAWRQGQYSGIKTAQTWYQRMWNAIKELWNKVKGKFGKEYADLDVFKAWEKKNSEELMKNVDQLLKGGKEIGKANGSDTRYELIGNNGMDLEPSMKNGKYYDNYGDEIDLKVYKLILKYNQLYKKYQSVAEYNNLKVMNRIIGPLNALAHRIRALTKDDLINYKGNESYEQNTYPLKDDLALKEAQRKGNGVIQYDKKKKRYYMVTPRGDKGGHLGEAVDDYMKNQK